MIFIIKTDFILKWSHIFVLMWQWVGARVARSSTNVYLAIAVPSSIYIHFMQRVLILYEKCVIVKQFKIKFSSNKGHATTAWMEWLMAIVQ